ncbi:MAG: peptide deformylase [Spirochaetaceae bacterium]|nr:peptide deformylase [Spirochaetaceae bacterium]
MEIIIFGNELLRQKAEPVKDFNRELKTFLENFLNTMRKEKGIGLAGPQVGFMKRIFAVQTEKDVPLVFINPSIVETSQEMVKYEEGCLSIPKVWAEITRPETVRVQAWNERGRPFTLEAEGILARAVLHEYDHLEGILFIDRLSELKRNKLIAKFEKIRALGYADTVCGKP